MNEYDTDWRALNHIMNHCEMRNFEPHYDPDEAEMTAQERLLYNNNYNSNHHHHNNPNNHAANSGSGGANSGSSMSSSNQHLPHLTMTSLDEGENHYQLPYAHLHQQSPYLPHHHKHHIHQPPPPHVQQQRQGSYSSGDEHSSTYGGGPRPPMNGHGTGTIGLYPHTYAGNFGTLQDKYSVAYPVRNEGDGMMGRRGNRATGSGIVYRPRRRLWWAAMMLALVLLVLAGAVVIAVYFTVLRKDEEPAKVVGNGDSEGHGHGSVGDGFHGRDGPGGTGVGGDFVTRQPPYSVPGTFKTPQDGSDEDIPHSGHTKVNKFDAYWHPGDSRIFAALLANGTAIEVFGPKKSDGTIKSIYSLSLKDPSTKAEDSPSYIRFQGGSNIASVFLPNGVIVNYDWSVDKHIEVKVFEPFTPQTRGPISHFVKVASNVHFYPLRQIHDVFETMPALSAAPNSGGRNRFSSKCFSRFPVKVNKCGGRFPYYGAFVQGEISGLGAPIKMVALPWPKESSDPCYAQDAGSAANYYLPLPGMVDKENATMIREAYVASSAKIFSRLCDVVKDLDHTVRHKVCALMAETVRAEMNAHHLLDSVYDSCCAIINALYTVCVAVHDIASNENMPSITENVLLRSFDRRISDSFPPDLPETVDIKAHGYCPSNQPISSYQSTVPTGSIRGNVVQDSIGINCPNYPEITFVGMNHMLAKTGDQYDLIKHNIRICSICSFERQVSAQIIKEEMMCNNTCTKKPSMESQRRQYIVETKDFKEQDSVYCSDFLTSIDNRIEPIGPNCLANCMSDLRVQIQIKDEKSQILYYDQAVKCSELQKSRCTMKFGK